MYRYGVFDSVIFCNTIVKRKKADLVLESLRMYGIFKISTSLHNIIYICDRVVWWLSLSHKRPNPGLGGVSSLDLFPRMGDIFRFAFSVQFLGGFAFCVWDGYLIIVMSLHFVVDTCWRGLYTAAARYASVFNHWMGDIDFDWLYCHNAWVFLSSRKEQSLCKPGVTPGKQS